jgi:hypothetical protein
MSKNPKLFMVLLGCTPKGRVTEQHDIFFGIAEHLTDLIPQMKAFWPEAKGKLHIDAWREITVVDDHSVEVVLKAADFSAENQLYFLNLGGYKIGEFEEYHYKMLAVGPKMAFAIKKAKKTVFYKHYGFNEKGAESHIDDRYGIDVDDKHKVNDLLNEETKSQYQIKISALNEPKAEDKLHIGYLKLKKL